MGRERTDERGFRIDNNEEVIRIDRRYLDLEVETLLGDATKAREKLGWFPNTTLEEMIKEMTEYDQELAAKEALLKNKGYRVYSSFENPPSSNQP